MLNIRLRICATLSKDRIFHKVECTAQGRAWSAQERTDCEARANGIVLRLYGASRLHKTLKDGC